MEENKINNTNEVSVISEEKPVKKRKRSSKFRTTKQQKIIRSSITILFFVAIFVGIYLALYFTGALQKIDSAEDIKNLILSGGMWSYAIFALIQFLQVTFIPIPAVVTTIAGALVFGPWITYIITIVTVLLGSMFAFWLGKKFGRKIIVWIAGKKDAEKWDKKLAQGNYLFVLMLLFPGFPDDILCMVVGATPMTFKFFMWANLATRPLIFAGMIFFGSGSIIPFSGWGIYVWVFLFIVMAVLLYLSVKYQKQIEASMINFAKKLKKLFSKKAPKDAN